MFWLLVLIFGSVNLQYLVFFFFDDVICGLCVSIIYEKVSFKYLFPARSLLREFYRSLAVPFRSGKAFLDLFLYLMPQHLGSMAGEW